jgi:hypothetical protein
MIFARAFVCLSLLTLCVGCGSSGKYAVTGTVKFADGTIPQGEIATLLFTPVARTPESKTASGDIKPDGTFTLMTDVLNDGAYPGEYKVTFNIWKTYLGRESLVNVKATDISTTPHTAKVTNGTNKFDFVLEKATP